MVWRVYIMPMSSAGNRRWPKYMACRANPAGLAVAWCAMDYGAEPMALVRADVDAAQHAALAANPDVMAMPVDLRTIPDAPAIAAIRDYLAANNIPDDWVSVSLSYAQIARRMGILFQLMQRLNRRIFSGGVVPLTPLSGLPVGARSALLAAARSFGADTLALTGASTVSAALQAAVAAWGTRPILLGGQEIA